MFRVVVSVYALLVVSCDGSALRKPRELEDDREGIVGGVPANLGEFPSQVSLRMNGRHNCGASILNKEWVLTAAHCVNRATVASTSVLSGTVDVESGGTVHPSSKIIIHANYDHGSLKNDIAVIKVSLPFDLDGYLRAPVKLPKQDQTTADGAKSTEIGWGRLWEGGPSPRRLQKVNHFIINQKKCKSIYNALGYQVYPSQICTAVPEGGAGSCNGDSGGPLFVDNIIVGIVSWSVGCAERNKPSVYSRVASYRNWIDKNIAA